MDRRKLKNKQTQKRTISKTTLKNNNEKITTVFGILREKEETASLEPQELFGKNLQKPKVHFQGKKILI